MQLGADGVFVGSGHLQVGRPGAAREGDRRGDDALPRREDPGGDLRGPGRADGRHLVRLARAGASCSKLAAGSRRRRLPRIKPMKIGVLALQGNFREHAAMLRAARRRRRRGAAPGAARRARRARHPRRRVDRDHAARCGSTASRRRSGGSSGAVLGTCAGMILLDREHLGLVDLAVDRNAYGRQVASFEADLELAGDDEPLRGVFIRAPRVREAGARRRGAGRARRRAGAAARRALPRRVVPSRADRRHARARALPRSSYKRSRMSGHSKWSTIKHKKGAADAKRGQLFTKLSQGDHRRGEGGRAGSGQQPRAAERGREGALLLDAEGHDRAGDRARRGHRRRRGGLRDGRSTRATGPRASPCSSRR